jgi:amino acid transporter
LPPPSPASRFVAVSDQSRLRLIPSSSCRYRSRVDLLSGSGSGQLPFSGTLRKVNQRSQTPVVALVVFGVIDLGVMIYGYNQPSSFGTLVGATAIIPYIIYFLITVAYAVERRTTDSLPGSFSLGRWAWPVIGFVLVYTVVIMVALSFPAPFHGSDKMLGYAAILAAPWYFGGLLRRIRNGTAGVKPVDDLAGKK